MSVGCPYCKPRKQSETEDRVGCAPKGKTVSALTGKPLMTKPHLPSAKPTQTASTYPNSPTLAASAEPPSTKYCKRAKSLLQPTEKASQSHSKTSKRSLITLPHPPAYTEDGGIFYAHRAIDAAIKVFFSISDSWDTNPHPIPISYIPRG